MVEKTEISIYVSMFTCGWARGKGEKYSPDVNVGAGFRGLETVQGEVINFAFFTIFIILFDYYNGMY
jgi:hypothetical protein